MTNAVNAGIVGVALPAINVTKIGQWIGVDANETHLAISLTSTNRPAFWNLDGRAQPIAAPQDVIFLVAFMENDGSSPDAIRGVVQTELLAARLTNTNRAYTAYVINMISNMTGTIDTARLLGLSPGHLNADDLIGGVQQLSLTTNDLAALNGLEPVSKTLRFTQRKANGTAVNDYTATFSFAV